MTKTRGEYAKTAERRQQIVDAAVEVFSAAGYRKGSLRDVAEKVGLSQAGLLHHYPSKEHLLEAVLTWRDDVSRQLMGEPLPEGIDLLRALVRATEYNETTPELVELHVIVSAEGTSADHPLRSYFVNRYADLFELIRQAFERAADEGQLRPGVDCASAARTLIALMDGLQLQWLLDRDRVDMAGDLRHYLQPLLTVELTVPALHRPRSSFGPGEPHGHELPARQLDPEASLEGPRLADDRHVPGVDDVDVPPGARGHDDVAVARPPEAEVRDPVVRPRLPICTSQSLGSGSSTPSGAASITSSRNRMRGGESPVSSPPLDHHSSSRSFRYVSPCPT